jgi:hypothetical protein
MTNPSATTLEKKEGRLPADWQAYWTVRLAKALRDEGMQEKEAAWPIWTCRICADLVYYTKVCCN